jgi:hypothetical protein
MLVFDVMPGRAAIGSLDAQCGTFSSAPLTRGNNAEMITSNFEAP